MHPAVINLYKELYNIASNSKDCNELGIFPTHFVGEKRQFKKGLPMFIGRDTLGLNQNKIPLISDYEYDSLQWLNEDGYYNKSHFWSVIGHSLANLRNENYGPSIYHDFYWGDLYKINFRAKEGTTQGLRSAQINCCAQLLLSEMDDLIPCAIVFLTGIDEGDRKGVGRFFERWEPRGQLKSKLYNNEFSLIGNAGIEHHCLVVQHPQGKGHNAIITQITSFLEKHLR